MVIRIKFELNLWFETTPFFSMVKLSPNLNLEKCMKQQYVYIEVKVLIPIS